jgi:adenine-specific DNA-methyltransferase
VQEHNIIRDNGDVLEVIEVNYKRNVMSQMRWTNEWIRAAEEPNKEFLFLIAK